MFRHAQVVEYKDVQILFYQEEDDENDGKTIIHQIFDNGEGIRIDVAIRAVDPDKADDIFAGTDESIKLEDQAVGVYEAAMHIIHSMADASDLPDDEDEED